MENSGIDKTDKVFDKIEEAIGKEHTATLRDKFSDIISNTKVNLLIVGATGVGKSTTIKALFDTHNAKELDIEIKGGGRPITMGIGKYKIDDNFTLYDSPGLGDSNKDNEHIKKIQELLTKKDDNGDALIDLVLILIDASAERDLESTFKTIKVIKEALAEKDRDRIIIALNKCDRGSSHPKAQWDYEAGKPNDYLKLSLETKVAQIQTRILETTGLKVEPIPYTAGYYDEQEDKQYKSYNLDKIIATAFEKIKGKDPRKVVSLRKNIKEKALQEGSNDGGANYKEEADNTFWSSVGGIVDTIAKTFLPAPVYNIGKAIISGIGKFLGF